MAIMIWTRFIFKKAKHEGCKNIPKWLCPRKVTCMDNNFAENAKISQIRFSFLNWAFLNRFSPIQNGKPIGPFWHSQHVHSRKLSLSQPFRNIFPTPVLTTPCFNFVSSWIYQRSIEALNHGR